MQLLNKNDSSSRAIKRVHQSEFLPVISMSRRLVQNANEDSIFSKQNNPFKVEPTLERALILGER